MTDRHSARPPWWQVVLAVAVGAAAITFVVMLTAGVLADGAGTGHPADFYRALGRELTDPTNWSVVAGGALVGAGGAGVATLLTRRR